MLSKQFYERLQKPFPIEDVYVRVGTKTKDGTKAMPMFYLIADAVRHRLDVACELEGATWDYDFQIISSPSELIGCNINSKAIALKSTITIRKGGTQVVRSSVGEEVFDKSDSQEVYKSAETDAFKRAAARFGVGGYLRSLAKMWFPLNGNYFSDKEDDIVKAVYSSSGISVSQELTAEFIADELAKVLKEVEPTLNNPTPFLEREFCRQYEQKNSLKEGSWWTIGKVFGIPIRNLSAPQIESLALAMLRNVNEENFLSALILSKALVVSARYPEHFGKSGGTVE